MSPHLQRARRQTPVLIDAVEIDPRTRTDADLLTFVLGGLTAGSGDARRLLDRFGDLGSVVSADRGEVMRAGVEPGLADMIAALREILMRVAREDASRAPVITSWGQLLAYVRVSLASLPREEFRALYLDKKNVLIRDELRACGTIDHAPVYNAGPARVARLGRVPEIRETQAYVEAVLDCFLALTAGRAVANSIQCRPRESGL